VANFSNKNKNVANFSNKNKYRPPAKFGIARFGRSKFGKKDTEGGDIWTNKAKEQIQ